jgi:hypothetical protein
MPLAAYYHLSEFLTLFKTKRMVCARAQAPIAIPCSDKENIHLYVLRQADVESSGYIINGCHRNVSKIAKDEPRASFQSLHRSGTCTAGGTSERGYV